MLVPAILYKDEVIRLIRSKLYDPSVSFNFRSNSKMLSTILDYADGQTYQFACLDYKNNVNGFVSYQVDGCNNCVYNFNTVFNSNLYMSSDSFVSEILTKLSELVSRFHRVEWKIIAGDALEEQYATFCETHGGHRIRLTDCYKQDDGTYADCILYEVIGESSSTKEIEIPDWMLNSNR